MSNSPYAVLLDTKFPKRNSESKHTKSTTVEDPTPELKNGSGMPLFKSAFTGEKIPNGTELSSTL